MQIHGVGCPPHATGPPAVLRGRCWHWGRGRGGLRVWAPGQTGGVSAAVPPGPRPLTMGPSCPHTDVLAPPPPPRPLSLQAACRRRVPSPERTSCQLRPSPNKTLEWGSSSVAHESHRGCRASSVGVSPGPGRRFLSPVGPEHLAEGGAGGCGGRGEGDIVRTDGGYGCCGEPGQGREVGDGGRRGRDPRPRSSGVRWGDHPTSGVRN